jgi:hypothetical protein
VNDNLLYQVGNVSGFVLQFLLCLPWQSNNEPEHFSFRNRVRDRLTGKVEGTIGAGYLDLGTFIVVSLPPSLQLFDVVVDATEADRASESYSISVMLLDNGTIVKYATAVARVNSGEQQVFQAKAQSESGVVEIATAPSSSGFWGRFWPFIIGSVAIGGLAASLVAMRHAKRRSKPSGIGGQEGYVPKFCLQCGAPLRSGSKFCLRCGARARRATMTPP